MSLPSLISIAAQGALKAVLPIQSSAGASSSGSIVALNSAGFVDASMLSMQLDGGDSRALFLSSQVLDGGNSATVYAAVSYKNIVLADSPVAYWPLDETSGTVANDLSGNGWNGTYTGGVTLGAVPFPAGGAGATFDGSTGYAYGDSGVPTDAIANVTMELWLNFNGNAAPHGGCALKLGSAGAGNGYGVGNGGSTMDLSGNNIIGLYEDRSWNATTVSIPVSGWRHLVNVINADSTSTFYLDGVQVATNSNSGINQPSISWGIASDYNGNSRFFNGTLANAALYDTVLTPAQILNHYNAGIA